jgi:hypothetical protein
MICLLVNGSFVIAFFGGVAGAVCNFLAQRNRAPNAPPGGYWRGGWDIFRPNVFTERGNHFRRLSLILNGIAAAFLLTCLTLIFTQRGDQSGLCWFQS